MSKLQSWTMTALAAAALVAGILLVTGALSFAQEGDESTSTPTPTATAESTDDAADSEDSDDEDGVRGCGGGKGLVHKAAAEVLGLSEDSLRDALMDGQTLAEVAQAQGMSVDDFKSALKEKVTADLQAELDAGDITQGQFDDITSDLDAKLDDIINHEGGFGHGLRPGYHGYHLNIVDAAAEVLGLSEDDLLNALRDGQTLAEIAEAQGMSADDFKSALVENITADLQAELDAGDIAQEQFDDITGDLDAKLDDIINAEGGLRFRHGPFGDAFPGDGAPFRAPFERAPLGSGT